MIDLATVNPGETIYVPFATYGKTNGESITMTGLAAADIEIYKDGSMTQRASDNGYTLLDTDGIDLDGITGIHGFSINLADNSDAGFYAAGSRYVVVVSSVTVDGQTVNFVAATFKIGYPAAILNTTIATLASQTSFTLTAGPAEDDALNGCTVLIHDVSSGVQKGTGFILDYTGATKTVTLAAGTSFTVAATDNISVFMPTDVGRVLGATATVVPAPQEFTSTGSPTTTSIQCSSSWLPTEANAFLNMFLVMTSGTYRNVARQITASSVSGGTMTLTVDAFPGAPTVGDKFIIIGKLEA